jgi:prefoldin subunit 5
MTPKEEAQMLKSQAKAMQEDINAINQRISELESASKGNK